MSRVESFQIDIVFLLELNRVMFQLGHGLLSVFAASQQGFMQLLFQNTVFTLNYIIFTCCA